jgi:hypothetical protein
MARPYFLLVDKEKNLTNIDIKVHAQSVQPSSLSFSKWEIRFSEERIFHQKKR